MLGLLLSDSSISSVSGWEWNIVHHCPGISAPFTKRWGSSPAIFVFPLVVENGIGVYPLTSGAGGGLKSGPTAQPARSTAAAAPSEKVTRMDLWFMLESCKFKTTPTVGPSVARR